MDILTQIIFENSLNTWVTALIITTISVLLLQFTRKFSAKKISLLAARTETEVDDLMVDLIRQTKLVFIFMISVYFGSLSLTLPDPVAVFIRTVATAIVFIQIAFWGSAWAEKKISHM